MPEPVSRRRFLDYLLGGGVIAWLAAVLYPLFSYLKAPPASEQQVASVKVGPASSLPLNSGVIFKFGHKPGLIIHTPDNQFKAFIAICTHLDCTVQYKPDWKLIWCACHNGRYNLDGINISGPPPRPLTPLTVHEKDGDLYVTKES